MLAPLALLLSLALMACKDEPIDADGDGFPVELDCDDDDDLSYPGSEELCDGADNDCDGTTDEDGVDGPGFYLDADGDTFGSSTFVSTACLPPEGYITDNTDCDDGDRDSYPGAPETCDQRDNDCDGTTDEDPTDAQTWYGDKDGDGYGKHTSGEEVACSAPEGYVDNDRDCNDGDATLNPDSAWYADLDGDGYGGEVSVLSCIEPDGFVRESADCDDNDEAISPGADEVCDGVDNDCDELTDDEDDSVTDQVTAYPDNDGDGYGTGDTYVLSCELPSGYAPEGGDCDDNDSSASPGVDEVCYDSSDNDCDGGTDEGCPDATVDDGDVIIAGKTTYDYFGYDLDAGDFDGDGVDDLMVAAYGDDTTASGSGKVYFFEGPFSAGSFTTSDATGSVVGAATSDYLGYVLATIPDLDGDGDDEALLTAYSNNTTATDAGAAYLFLGPISGSLTTSDARATFLGGSSTDNLGYYLATGGSDLTGDGVGDIVVGAHNVDSSSGATSSGAVYVFSGSSSGSVGVGSGSATILGSSTQDYVGYCAEATRDYDGDGAADLAVGVSGDDKVVLYFGPLSGSYTLADADVVVSGALSGDATGSNVMGGDSDGDGHDDLFVGAKFDRDGGTYSGAWALLSGPLTTNKSLASDAVAKVSEDGTSLYFGAQYQGAAVADLDSDGLEDVFLGSYTSDFLASSGGAAYGYYGPLVGTLSVADAELFIAGSSSNDYVGNSLFVGDLDDDGLPDLGLAARGRNSSTGMASIFFGSSL